MKLLNLKKEIHSNINKKNRGIHSYAAKMVNHIPSHFLSKEKENSIVLDPFCGSGTVLKEASKKGMVSYGLDINPLAKLISKVETTPINKNHIYEKLGKIKREFCNLTPSKQDFPNIDYWFNKNVQNDLSKLKKAIDLVSKGKYKDFFYVCFSAIIRKVSYADPRISPPVKSKQMVKIIREGFNVDVFHIFEKQVKKAAQIIEKNNPKIKTKIVGNDARYINLPSRSVNVVITSPPYINAQKYFRSTQLELYWLGFVDNKKLRLLDKKMIGTERVSAKNYNDFKLTNSEDINKILKRYKNDKKIAHIIFQYYTSMILVIKEIYRVLKKDGKLIFVIGDNNIRGKVVPSGKIFQEVLNKTGFKLDKIYFDKIENYSLMTKRNKTANIIKKEWVIVAKK